ncbi:hypothetical protein N7494_012930 [Penicillium frequentans]|uniref:Isomerase n=1 Tax=Penicillium frequentans TaxID=3151616 RepID=A0AAD6GC60_9EURO|nr:hypothetical protein N7494_012930 [Penicillium glabrum]
MEKVKAYNLSVFPYSTDNDNDGGNPTTIFLGAEDLTSEEMQSLTQKSGHECGFILPAPADTNPKCHYKMCYWVPNHEMEMCGHATVGAIWLLKQLGLLATTSTEDFLGISTLSGIVEAKVLPGASLASCEVLVSQPKGTVEELSHKYIPDILSSLGLAEEDLAPEYPIQNGCTSRTKTLIPLKSRDVIQNLTPNSESIRRVCEQIDSTGLYPYVVIDSTTQLIEARQFPRSVGYVEDPATGIAAAALLFGLVENGIVDHGTEKPVRVRQGWAMGKPSEISVCLRHGGEVGCWITGKVKWQSC